MSPEVIRNLGWDLLSGSAKAALLGIFVLAVRRLLRRHLSPDWRLILGGVVLLRLVWPWEIPTPVSLFNVTVPLLPSINAWSFPIDGWRWALAVWVAGMIIGLARVFAQWRRVRASIDRSTPADARWVGLWNEVVEGGPAFLAGVSLRSSGEVDAPCVAGLIRPCLLVPADLAQRFSRDEIRLMFLHEMAHLRRRDLWVNLVLEIIRIVHWFNPVVEWVLRRWREDREELCDVHALNSARGSNLAYGRVLLKCIAAGEATLPGGRMDSVATPMSVGWLGTSTTVPRSLVHRIEAIARFRKDRRTWIVGSCTLAAVALLGLTEQEPLPPRRVWLLESHLARHFLPQDVVSGSSPAPRGTPET